MLSELEHYEAASLDEISAINGLGTDDVEEFYFEDDFRNSKLPVGGYGNLLNKIAENLNI